jgi:hypothetical protein
MNKVINNQNNICAALGLAGLALVSTARADFVQGFETDITGWETPTRVASGTDGITSFSGGYHAETLAGAGDFTRWGGYNYGAGATPTAFQPYTTSIAIYLNVGGGWADNTRFDFSSAINNAAGTHLSDFIFNAGFYNSGDVTGPGAGTDRFVISASYNSQPTSAFPKNTGAIAISSSGWYVFSHTFYDNGGVLAVDMTITDALNNLVNTWTLTSLLTPGVGGNRYGWFDFNEFPFLAIDQSELSLTPVPEPTTMIAGALLLLPFGATTLRMLRKSRKA